MNMLAAVSLVRDRRHMLQRLVAAALLDMLTERCCSARSGTFYCPLSLSCMFTLDPPSRRWFVCSVEDVYLVYLIFIFIMNMYACNVLWYAV